VAAGAGVGVGVALKLTLTLGQLPQCWTLMLVFLTEHGIGTPNTTYVEGRDKGLASALFVGTLLRINEVIHVASGCAARHFGAEKGQDDTQSR
jgi:hypothetical protein